MTKKLSWKDRPFRQDDGPQLIERYRAASGELAVVRAVAYELQFRRAVSSDAKAEVMEQLVTLYSTQFDLCQKILHILRLRLAYMELTLSGKDTPPEQPLIDFDTQIKDRRRRNLEEARLNGQGWQEIGVLRASGYSVGKTSDVPEDDRRLILRHIFLVDDLQDVQDRAYATQWGEPKTAARLKKIVDSITTFARNSKRRFDPRYAVAIDEWESDLTYLKATFYDCWGDFPWPDLDA